MDVLFVSGVAAIVEDRAASLSFYRDWLGLPLEGDDYPATTELEGVKHFGLWSLSDAARSCFDQPVWPAEVPVPQACVEFEVADVAGAAEELIGRGARLLVGPKVEPWGQTVARLLSPEGLLLGVTCTPWYQAEAADSTHDATSAG